MQDYRRLRVWRAARDVTVVADDLGFCNEISVSQLKRDVREVKSMLAGLQRSVRMSIERMQ